MKSIYLPISYELEQALELWFKEVSSGKHDYVRLVDSHDMMTTGYWIEFHNEPIFNSHDMVIASWSKGDPMIEPKLVTLEKRL